MYGCVCGCVGPPPPPLIYSQVRWITPCYLLTFLFLHSLHHSLALQRSQTCSTARSLASSFSHQPSVFILETQGYNVSLKIITAETKDGRFGGNSTGIQYGGNYAMALGTDVFYGFHGEFWKSGEANQFLHFRDGQFLGQFGTPGLHYTINCGATQGTQRIGDWSLPGSAGNSMSPSLVAGRTKDELFFYHNDESQHAGVHRWRVAGLDTITQITETKSVDAVAQRQTEITRTYDTRTFLFVRFFMHSPTFKL
jgi:hypothetical protein